MGARKEDPDNNGYSKRKLLDLKTIQILLMAFLGTGGITGLTSYLTDPNIAIQTKVNNVAVTTQAQELKINTLDAEVKLKSMRVENYIKSHAEKASLKDQLIDQEFKHIRELLVEIRADLKVIKNGR